mgnify:CR=1 FL=1
MSIAALLIATKTHLVTTLGLDPAKHIDALDTGQPSPFVGQLYYVVHPTSWESTNPDPADTLDETYGLSVTITQRSAVAPRDKHASEIFLKAITGLGRQAREVMVAVHLNYDLMNAANALMTGEEKLCEPLRFRGADASPRTVDGDWFFAEADKASGMVLEVRFGGARRIQAVHKHGGADVVE